MRRLILLGLITLFSVPSFGMKILNQEAIGQQIHEFSTLNPMFKKAGIGQCVVMSTPGVFCFAKGKAKNTFWRAFSPVALAAPYEPKGSSYIQLFQTDCVNYRVRAIRTTLYSKPNLRGQVSDLKETRDWEYPAPDEVDITTGMDAICGK